MITPKTNTVPFGLVVSDDSFLLGNGWPLAKPTKANNDLQDGVLDHVVNRALADIVEQSLVPLVEAIARQVPKGHKQAEPRMKRWPSRADARPCATEEMNSHVLPPERFTKDFLAESVENLRLKPSVLEEQPALVACAVVFMRHDNKTSSSVSELFARVSLDGLRTKKQPRVKHAQ
eukprot:Amastigsp_a676680_59.p2 type:complete len:176 gc:universal Amastigsp_a676680_59:545-1072(+)